MHKTKMPFKLKKKKKREAIATKMPNHLEKSSSPDSRSSNDVEKLPTRQSPNTGCQHTSEPRRDWKLPSSQNLDPPTTSEIWIETEIETPQRLDLDRDGETP